MIITDFYLLGLTPDATPEQVKAAYHERARILHPDAGGDAGQFAELVLAYQRCLAHAEAPKPCPDCLGLGKKRRTVGYFGIDVVCPTCKGKKTQ